MNFIDHLNTLIASNQPDKALEEIRRVFRDYKKAHPDEAEDVNQLEQQIILHSARLKELDSKERNIQLSSSEIDVAKSRMYSALLGIISSFSDYPDLKQFLSGLPVPESTVKTSAPPPQASFHTPPQARQPRPQPVLESAPKTKSNNGTVLGILGTVAVVAVAALIYIFTTSDDPASDPAPLQSPGEAVISQGGPQGFEDEGQTSDEEIEDQSISELSLWQEIKILPTLPAIDEFLKEYPDGEHAQAATSLRDSMQAALQEDEEHLWEVVQRTNTVEMYDLYLRTTELGLYNEEAEQKRDELVANMDEGKRFDELMSMANADTLAIHDQLALWRSSGEEFSGEHLDSINTRISKAESMIGSYASITEDDKFVTCSSVSENRNPIGVATEFPGPNVYVWARVHAPRSESLTVRWLDAAGNEIGTRGHSVQTNTGLGYRIYSMQRFQEAGDYEVRLYNSKDVLIARETFRVN